MTDETAPPFELADAFFKRQEQLLATLGVGDISAHPTTKGDHTELRWREMLHQFLPRRYGVSSAFVVDSKGGCSEQIDIVIHDQHFSPLLFDIGHAKYIPAESVYAVIEVRPDLDKENLAYAARKIVSVRELHRTSVDIPHAGGKYDAITVKPIIGAILCRRSAWSPPFGEALKQCLTDLATAGDNLTGPRIDLGCALAHGAFSVHVNDEGVALDLVPAKVGLVYFVLRLMRMLQVVGSAPAIDYDAYLESAPRA